jgi:hypothetical protein
MIKLYDIVEFPLENAPIPNTFNIGTIIHIYASGTACEIEYQDRNGSNTAVVPIEKIKDPLSAYQCMDIDCPDKKDMPYHDHPEQGED